jgi:putative redox protein
MARPNEVIVRGGESGFVTEIMASGHVLQADEPLSAGGTDTGPNPYDLLLASLGACTSMTLRMFADRRGWPLAGVTVRLWHSRTYDTDCEGCVDKPVGIDQIAREIELAGPLSEEQQEALIQIADRCPIGQTLSRGVLPARAARISEDDARPAGDERYS